MNHWFNSKTLDPKTRKNKMITAKSRKNNKNLKFMEKRKCGICNKEAYEKILLYDFYTKALERNGLNSGIRKKIEYFKNRKKECIYICDDCFKDMKGMNEVKTL